MEKNNAKSAYLDPTATHDDKEQPPPYTEYVDAEERQLRRPWITRAIDTFWRASPRSNVKHALGPLARLKGGQASNRGSKTKDKSSLQITVGPIDKTRVPCRCGRRLDTTQQQQDLPPGQVLCECGYIVTNSGYSFKAKPERTPLLLISIGPLDHREVKCACGRRQDTTTPEPGQPPGQVHCECGYIVTSDGRAFYDRDESEYVCTCKGKDRHDCMRCVP